MAASSSLQDFLAEHVVVISVTVPPPKAKPAPKPDDQEA